MAHSSCAILHCDDDFISVYCARAHTFSTFLSHYHHYCCLAPVPPYIYPFSFTCSLRPTKHVMYAYTNTRTPFLYLLLQLHCLRNSNALGKNHQVDCSTVDVTTMHLGVILHYTFFAPPPSNRLRIRMWNGLKTCNFVALFFFSLSRHDYTFCTMTICN